MSPHAILDSLGATAAGPLAVRALVLAAGQGRRFGGPKLLAPYRGRPLLSHVLDVVSAAGKPGMLSGGHVVVGSEDEATRALVEEAGLEPIINDAPHLGLSRSLKLGLATLETRRLGEPHTGAALILLADQPLVRLEVVKALIAAWRAGAGAIVRPRYEARPDVPGHPVLLDRSIWPLVHQLEGDSGFAGLLDSGSTPTVTLAVAGDNPDVDTPADLEALEESSR